ncbi:MAG: VOC family protein [Gammaproteobacteria bacterium]|nr:VOC family protein [Gammaproteobacteria bacterium]MBU6510194.1 VOC family protein [Gammaproteobacteria bacterium]MDE2108850.1 VOC family protein [Gammaproteobacteria bacterium]MDE2459623.1 VOC family protein [Gammaproteobacteria bacterium]
MARKTTRKSKPGKSRAAKTKRKTKTKNTRRAPPIPKGYHSITPYLIINGAAAALEFYKNAFGAKEKVRMPEPSGRIGHAEIMIGSSHMMLADEHPEINARAPQAGTAPPVSIVLYVKDVDAVFERAVNHGARVERPLENQFYGDRTATLIDPHGHRWHIHTHIEDVSPKEMQRRMQSQHQ